MGNKPETNEQISLDDTSGKALNNSSSSHDVQKGEETQQVTTMSEAVELCSNKDDSGKAPGGGGRGKSKYSRKFTPKDDVRVLKVLIKHGYKRGTRQFWRDYHSSLGLSFSVEEIQLYEKVWRLKKAYFRRLNTDKQLSPQQLKIHNLSHKIWGNNNNNQEVQLTDGIPETPKKAKKEDKKKKKKKIKVLEQEEKSMDSPEGAGGKWVKEVNSREGGKSKKDDADVNKIMKNQTNAYNEECCSSSKQKDSCVNVKDIMGDVAAAESGKEEKSAETETGSKSGKKRKKQKTRLN